MIEVLDGGVQSTVQDGGRPGYLAAGYPPAGRRTTTPFRSQISWSGTS